MAGLFGDWLQGANDWRDQNPGVLTQIGTGIMSGDLATGFQNASALQQKARERQRMEALKGQTAQALLSRGLAKTPEEAALFAENPDLLRYFVQTGGAEDLPASVQEYEYGKAHPEYNEWANTRKGRDSTLMAGDRQAVRESEDIAVAADNSISMLKSVLAPGSKGELPLNERAGSGVFAKSNAWLARNDPTGLIFDSEEGKATTELENVVLNQALASLKAIFGAAPTEGERQILVDLQASVDKTPAERKIIIDNAIRLAEKRKAFYLDRANELRGGTYYQPGGGMSGGAPGGNGVDDLVDKYKSRP